MDAAAVRTVVKRAIGSADPLAHATREGVRWTPESVHITQVSRDALRGGTRIADHVPGFDPGLYLSPDCGPASAAMAVRLAGSDVVGAAGSRNNLSVIDAARQMANAVNRRAPHFSPEDVMRVIEGTGLGAPESRYAPTVLAWARSGTPAAVLGRSGRGWQTGLEPPGLVVPPTSWPDHWVTLSGYVRSADRYVVNDPGMFAPIRVTADQIVDFMGDGLAVAAERT